MSTQMHDATKIELYAPSAVALFFALLAVIIAIVAEINSISVTNLNPNNSITSIQSANGFSGTVKDHIATLSTTVTGLISGQKGGSLSKATDVQIVQATMQNFEPNYKSLETTNITSFNNILEAIEKGSVLTQTTFGSAFQPVSGMITPSDTLYQFFQKGQGILNSRSNLFSAFGKGFVNASRPLWVVPPVYGSTVLPAGFWNLGTAISIQSIFQWNTGGQGSVATFSFTFNNQSIVLTFGQYGLAIDKLTLTIVLVAQTDSLLNVYMTATTSGNNTIIQNAASQSQVIPYDSISTTELGLIATVAGTSNLLTFNYAVGSILFQT
jgi:hypothetical protein